MNAGSIPNHYRYLTYLSMLFVVVKLIATLTIYKIVTFGIFDVSASYLIIPLWFFISDIVAEVYGFKISRQLIIATVILEIIFTIIFSFLIKQHSPDYAGIEQDIYDKVCYGLNRGVIANSIAILIGGLCNTFLITKTKRFFVGQYLTVRIFLATSIGELVFFLIASLLQFAGLYSFMIIFKIIAIAYLINVIMNIILIIPTAIITNTLKRAEGINLYDANNGKNLFDSINEVVRNTTKLTKLYTADDNKTYFTDIEIEIPMRHELGHYSKEYSAIGFKIREFKPNATIDWHTSPNPRYVIYLEGEIEITASSGQKRIFKAGDILFATDTTGEGHTTTTKVEGRSVIILME